jgi:hypothetical protein
MIKQDIESTPEIMNGISKCMQLLNSVYLMGPHFNQKNIYLSKISTHDLNDLIYRVLTVVMPLAKGLTFSALIGQVAGVIEAKTSKLDSFKIASSVVSYMYYSGLLKLIRADDSKSGMMEILPVYLCDQKIIDHAHETRYMPPMICAPKTLVTNNDCGYLTVNKESVILKNYNHHEQDICLDSINKFNSVAFSLDVKMLTTYDDEYKKEGKTRKGNPIVDSHERRMQFQTLMQDSYSIYKLLIQHGNNFHFTHKYDKRGRTYTMGYHVSPQGNSFRKAILNLKKEELVNGNFC